MHSRACWRGSHSGLCKDLSMKEVLHIQLTPEQQCFNRICGPGIAGLLGCHSQGLTLTQGQKSSSIVYKIDCCTLDVDEMM